MDQRHEQLFIVRIWSEPTSADGGKQWRGSVRDVGTGTERGFSGLRALHDLIATRLDETVARTDEKSGAHRAVRSPLHNHVDHHVDQE